MGNPFKVIYKGLKYILKGTRYILNRPEMQIAALVIPGLGYAQAANILRLMMQAERSWPETGSGPTKLMWVLDNIDLLTKDSNDIPDVDDAKLSAYIKALIPVLEGTGELLSALPELEGEVVGLDPEGPQGNHPTRIIGD